MTPPKPGTFRKGPPIYSPEHFARPKPPPRTEVRNAPVMPGKTLASKIIKPVGAALFLFVSLAHAQTLTIPFSGAPTRLFPDTASGGGNGTITGPTPPVTNNSIVTWNGTGATAIQASPCTLDATGFEVCPPPTGMTQGAMMLQEGVSFGTKTWQLTLGPSALAANYVCAIDPATGGFPPTCLDTIDIAHGGTGQTTKAAAFNALSPFPTASAAPFTCSATTAGAYVDTDCNQVCICAGSGVTGTPWCRSDTGACLSTTDCCTPALVSWVPLMAAYWTLDEASGTRADTSGHGLGLSDTGSTANDTTNKMQGTASALFTGTTHFFNNSSVVPAAPVTVGCWLRETMNAGGFGAIPFGNDNFSTGGLQMIYDDANKRYTCQVLNASNAATSCSVGGSNATLNTFSHVAMVVNATDTSVCQYINGAANGGCGTGTNIYAAVSAYDLGGVSSAAWSGNADECFVYAGAMTASDLCRVCSCGIDGSLCTCSTGGVTYATAGRNSTNCGSCSLTGTNCNAQTP